MTGEPRQGAGVVRGIVAAKERSDGGPRVVLAIDRSARLMAELRQMADLELVPVDSHPGRRTRPTPSPR